MPDVFLSYSREDQATARRFAQGFEREGLSVWWDQTLNAGEDYDQVTEQALETAKAVVVLWSTKSVSSRWVRAEATQADRNATLVPAMIEPCKRPIMFELKHTADLSNWSGDGNDKDWQAYLATVQRMVRKRGPVAAPPQVAVVSDRRRISPAAIAIGLGVLLVAGVIMWMLRTRPTSSIAQVAPSATVAAAGMTQTQVSIAVLPFVNMSSDPEQEYFSDGLSEELLNQLAQVPQLRVVGRTSSFAFKGKNEDLRHIGEVLGVNHLLEGSVRKAGKRVLITAQLIRQSDGSHLWSQTYERSLDDIFAIQEEIARNVTQELQVRMGTSSGSGTKNVAAYDEFLAGRALLNSNDSASMQAAAPRFERAVALDPTYVQAWLWMVDAYIRATPGDSRKLPQYEKRLNAAIDQVVALAPKSPEASFALSYRAAREHHLIDMEHLLNESLKLTGGLGVRARLRHGQFLVGVGRATEAVLELEQVKKDDPLDVFSRTNLLLAYEIKGDSARADTEMQQLLALPGGRTPALLGTAVSRALARRDVAKLNEALLAVKDTGTDVSSVDGKPLLDDPALALPKLRSLYVGSSQANIYTLSSIAQWSTYFGDHDLALRALQSMSHKGYSFEIWAGLLWRPVLRDLHGEPAFKKLITDLGIADYWRATGKWGDFCNPVGKDDFECR
ncbi:MAG: TIR domain-containing protein [Pseudomonadota bacterium]